MTREKKIFFISIVIKAALAAIIIARFGFNAHFTDNDVNKFLIAGVNLFRHGVFSMELSAPFMPTMFIPPIYSIFLALNFFIFGKFWVLAVYILQGIAMSWAAVYLYRNLKDLVGGRSAFWSAMLFAVEPFSNFIANVVTPDSFFTIAILVGIMKFWNFLRNQRKDELIASSIFISIATLIKPISQFLPVVFVLILVVVFWKNKIATKTRLKYAVYYVLIFLAILSPWIARNKITFNSLSITSLPSYNIYFYNAASVIAKENKVGIGEAQDILFKKAQKETGVREYKDFFDPKYSSYLRLNALKILLSHKMDYLKIHLLTLVPFFVNDGYNKIYPIFGLNLHNDQSITLLFSGGNFSKAFNYIFSRSYISLFFFGIGKVFWIIIYAFIFKHLYGIWKRKDISLLNFAFFAIVILYFAVLTGPVAAASYRMPVQPLIFILLFI